MNHNNLPKHLKQLRAMQGYSQLYVADKLNISRQTYSHYETGRIMPPPDSLCALAKLYRVSIDMLLSEDSDQTSENHTFNSASAVSDITFSPNYITYTADLGNKKRFSDLTPREKQFLFYYSLLEERDQNDILTFMEIKCSNRKKQ